MATNLKKLSNDSNDDQHQNISNILALPSPALCELQDAVGEFPVDEDVLVTGGVPRFVAEFTSSLQSVNEETNRVFKVGTIFVYSDLKELANSFGLKWNFVTVRSGKRISCNRAKRYGKGSYRKSSSRKSSTITCGCGWVIRFKWIDRKKSTKSDSVMISVVCGFHSNTCDPTFVGRKRSIVNGNKLVASSGSTNSEIKIDSNYVEHVSKRMKLAGFSVDSSTQRVAELEKYKNVVTVEQHENCPNNVLHHSAESKIKEIYDYLEQVNLEESMNIYDITIERNHIQTTLCLKLSQIENQFVKENLIDTEYHDLMKDLQDSILFDTKKMVNELKDHVVTLKDKTNNLLSIVQLKNHHQLVKSFMVHCTKLTNDASTKVTMFPQETREILPGTKTLIDLAKCWSDLNPIYIEMRSDSLIQKSIDWIKKNTSNAKDTEKVFVELNELRDRIGYIVCECVGNAASKLISADPSMTGALNLVKNSQEEIIFLLTFHLLYSQKGSLYEWVLNHKQKKFNEEDNMDSLLTKAQKSLSCALHLLTHKPLILFSNGESDILNELLSFLQNHDVFLLNIKDIVGRDDFVCSNEVIGYIKTNISKCDHKTCCTLLVKPLNDLKKKFLNISFLNEKRLHSPNDHAQKEFYTEINQLYHRFTTNQLLSSHAYSVGVDLQAMERDFTSKLQTEIKEVGDCVTRLLEKFPEVEITCLKDISIWYGNLNSIEKHLKVSSNLATLSKQLKDYVNNLLLGKIKKFVGEVKNFDSMNDFVHSLIIIKRSSICTVYWTKEINSEIDKLLVEASRKSDNNSFLRHVANALYNLKGDDAPTSKQLLSDHNSFECVANFVSNSPTV